MGGLGAGVPGGGRAVRHQPHARASAPRPQRIAPPEPLHGCPHRQTQRQRHRRERPQQRRPSTHRTLPQHSAPHATQRKRSTPHLTRTTAQHGRRGAAARRRPGGGSGGRT
eukprot:2426491-Rhodomonas_salina.2